MVEPTDRILTLLAELGERLGEAAPDDEPGGVDTAAPADQHHEAADWQLGAFLEAVNACRAERGERPVNLAQLARAAMANLGFSRAERRGVLDRVRGGGVDGGGEQVDQDSHRTSRRVGSG